MQQSGWKLRQMEKVVGASVQRALLLLLCIKVIHRTTNTHEVRHLLQVEGDCSHLYVPLLPYLCNDLFLCERSFFRKDPLNNICNSSRLIAPLLEGVEATTNEDKLWVANELIMDSLDGDVLVIEVCLLDLICDIHEVEWFILLLEDNFYFIADAAWPYEAPLRESPAILNLL